MQKILRLTILEGGQSILVESFDYLSNEEKANVQSLGELHAFRVLNQLGWKTWGEPRHERGRSLYLFKKG